MALLIVFLGYSFLMFQAGYQWRKWGRSRDGQAGAAPPPGVQDSQSLWNGMIGKI